MIRNEDYIQEEKSSEPTTISFRIETLICRISCYAANNYQTLHCKLESAPDTVNQWMPEMLHVSVS
jgi:hypothetical protein